MNQSPVRSVWCFIVSCLDLPRIPLPIPPCWLTTESTSSSPHLSFSASISSSIIAASSWPCHPFSSALYSPPLIQPTKLHLPVSTRSEQRGRLKGFQRGSRLLLTVLSSFPSISASAGLDGRGEPVTKWSIYLLNEKIAFFDCERTLHLMCVRCTCGPQAQ